MKKNFKCEKWISRISLVTIALTCQNAVYATDVLSGSTVVSSIIQQEGRTISGTVTDEQGNSIPGANILIKGTSIGTISDMNGNFEILVPSNQNILQVSFIGYKNKEVTIGNNKRLNVQLSVQSEQLNEVVVTALGIKREKKALGYAMQEVKTDNLTENKSISLSNMLQGKVAGVQIAQSGSGMGGSTRIIMRGLNSLSGKNQPLWVIDGIPINDDSNGDADEYGGTDLASAASQINPEDIESISILKGANAAALYGSRAQSGAIIITTKKGKQGQPLQLEYNGNIQFSKVYNPYDYQNIYGQGSSGVFSTSAKGSWGPKMEGQMVDNWKNVIYGNTDYGQYALLPQDDYIKEFYDTGVQYSNTVTASAGSDKLTGRLSFTDSRNNGIVPNHSINRQYFDLNTEFKNDFLTIGAKANYMIEKTNNAPAQGSYGLMSQFITMPRGIRLSDLSTDMFKSNGQVQNWTGPAENYTNPYGMILPDNGNKNTRNRFLGQIKASLKLTSYLNLTGRVGVDWYNDQYRKYAIHQSDGSTASQYVHSETSHKDFTADLILNFNKTFGDFGVTANLGTSVENQSYEGLAGDAGTFQITDFIWMGNGDKREASESFYKKEIQSVFGNASVSWKSMLYLDVTGRNDWSSTLPKENRSYFYPSVSLSGIISEMLKMPDWIDYLKVRASWAKVGNDTDPYKLAYAYSKYGSLVNGGTILEMQLPDELPLSDLKPESTNSYEAGLEWRMFQNRLGIDFTYYQSATTDQILAINTPVPSGYTSKLINAGKIRSKGYELTVTGTPILTKDWKWDITLNWGLNRTECIELGGGIKRYTLGSTSIASVVINEGGKYGDIVATNAYQRDANGNILIGDDGLPLTETDKVIGNMLPKWTGSIGTGLQWKNLSLNALIDIRYGGDFISMTDANACSAGTSARTLEGRDKMVVDGILASTGEVNTIPVTAQEFYTKIGSSSGVAEEFMYKGTYVKMRELSIGWNLPTSWLKPLKLQAVKVSAVGRDLFYFYKDAPVDPESAISSADYAQAFEYGSMPPTRSFGFSLNVKF